MDMVEGPHGYYYFRAMSRVHLLLTYDGHGGATTTLALCRVSIYYLPTMDMVEGPHGYYYSDYFERHHVVNYYLR